MATPNRSIRLGDEAMEFINGLAVVYGSPDKGILAIAAILSLEALATHAEPTGEPSKPEAISGKLYGFTQKDGVIQGTPSVLQSDAKTGKRSESVAQRKERESKEHAAALAEADTVARMVGRTEARSILGEQKMSESRFLPPQADRVPGLIGRYQACAQRIWELFPVDPLPIDDPAHFYLERLESILNRGFLQPLPKGQ